MKRLLALLGIALTLALSSLDGSTDVAQQSGPRLSRTWKRVTAGDIVAFSNASEKAMREKLDEIASFRLAFKRIYPTLRLDSPVPYRLVLFDGGQQALRRYAPRDERGRPIRFVSGYFSSEPDVNLIALGNGRSEIVFHEFAHSFIDRNYHSLPLWLNEGLAEFHSTFQADWEKGRSLMGRAPAARLRSLRFLSFIPVKELISDDPAAVAKFWRDPLRIEMYYAESWALVHYLQIGRQQNAPASFGRFVNAIELGMRPDQALREFFDVTPEQLDAELRRYIRRPTFNALSFDLPRLEEGDLQVEPLTEADVSYIEGDMLARVGAFDDADAELARALRLDPAHVGARIALANVRLNQDRAAEAVDTLRPIVEAAPANFAATYGLAAALGAAGRHLDALDMYGRATRLLDGSPHAWYGVSLSALALGRVAQSNAVLSLVRERQSTPRWYRRRAYDALRLGRDAEAAADARKYLAEAGWDKDTVYVAFVAALAHRRQNQPEAAAEILDSARQVANIPDWTAAVIDFLQDRSTAAAFLERADTDGEKTEAHAYIGLRAAIDGRTDEAVRHLRWVRERGARTCVECALAKGELKRLEAAAAQAGAPAAPPQRRHYGARNAFRAR